MNLDSGLCKDLYRLHADDSDEDDDVCKLRK
jgi:hypothetical protein